MPAYTTVEFVFFKKDVQGPIVGKFYNEICTFGVEFEKVLAWGCEENLTIEEIITWNQDKLNSNFELGFTEDVSNGYRQVILSGTPFTSCRIYISNSSNFFSFHLIVPESEVEKFRLEKIKDISRNVWASLPVKCIQTYDELSDFKTFEELENRQFPATDYFSFSLFDGGVNEELYDKVSLEKGYLFEKKGA